MTQTMSCSKAVTKGNKAKRGKLRKKRKQQKSTKQQVIQKFSPERLA